MCTRLGVTPKQLGQLRKEDPIGVYVLEQRIIYDNQKEREMIEEQQRKQKQRGRRH